MIAWLSFTPSYTWARGAQTKPLGAHAFRDDAPRSLCGYVARVSVGGTADADARRCTWCGRVVSGRSPDRSNEIRVS